MRKILLFIIFSLTSFIFSLSYAENINIKEIKTYNNYSSMWDVVQSKDWTSFSFSAKKKWWFVIVKDWKEIWNEYYNILDYSYSDNSIYYIAEKSYDEYILVKDWEEILELNLKPKNLVTSKEWWKYAIINTNQSIILNWELITSYKKIANFFFLENINIYWFKHSEWLNINWSNIKWSDIFSSPNWTEYSYITKKDNWKYTIIKKWADLNINTEHSYDFKNVTYSKSNDLFYIIWDVLYKNNNEYFKLESNSIVWIYISDDWNKVAYQDSKYNIFIDWKYFESKTKVDDFIFSPNNKGYAFTINKNKTSWLFWTSLTSIIKNWGKITWYNKTYSPLFLDNWSFAFIWEIHNTKDDNNKYKRYLVLDWIVMNLITWWIDPYIYSVDWKNIIFYISNIIWEAFLWFYSNNIKDSFSFTDNIAIPKTASKNQDLFSFTDNIATPKTISKDPNVIWINWLVAFLYILMFYFSWATFNSYFQNSNWFINKMNEKISLYWWNFWKTLFNILKKKWSLSKNKKLNLFSLKILNLIKKYSHKINIIIWFIVLWIISQILVWELDLNSINGYIFLFILILVVWILSLLKDLILYLNLKKTEKEKIKINLIPSWFIFLSLVAIFVNLTKIVPGTLFWATHKLNISDKVKEKSENWATLFLILILVYLIWIWFWFSTLLFQENSIYYKIALTNYFSISSDIFFNLLPFWLFWWVYIFNNKKKNLKKYWIIFMFISFFTLLHTIFNPKWDFSKVLSLQSNNLNIFIIILIFWSLITFWFWYYNKKISKNLTINS